MPGLNLSQISSNWKILQGRLNAERKPDPPHTDLKRKRLDDGSKLADGYKKVKLLERRPRGLRKYRQMGANASKAGEEKMATQSRSRLTEQYGVSKEDMTAAYGTSQDLARTYSDEINGGLHPTHKLGKYIGIDCEMVGTGPPPYEDNVLARVSAVNFHGEQVYDTYVQPPSNIRVEDYRTFVSGIRPHHLRQGYARPLAEVHKDVANLTKARILVGHALWNDLQVLLLSHPKRDIRDTSQHPKFRVDNKGRPPALRHLAKSELGMEIQSGEHSSVEDARAAMMLFRKEKAGFEEENRKMYGQRVQKPAATQAGGSANSLANVDDDDDDGEDLEGQDNDDESDSELAVQHAANGLVKKKRKKKKRTKRK